MEEIKKTPLYEKHLESKGKMIEFAGWMMPVEYSGILPEHHAVRNNAGLFDVSHMGEVDVRGKDAAKFAQNLVTNNVAVMENNQIIYAQMCYPEGGVVDDLLVYKYDMEHFLLVINASNIEKDFQWMMDNRGNYEVELKNISDGIGEVALQGPKAQEVLQKLTDKDLSEIKFFFFSEKVKVAGIDCLVSRTGYTGEDGFEIYTTKEEIAKIWDAILEAGKDMGVLPTGLGCRDTLRFEAALPLYGNEISKDITPLEAGLGFFVKLDNDDFIGKAALVKQKAEGLKRKTVGFELTGKGIPRHGYPVQKDGKEIGVVTTGYISPTLGKTIGLALVEAEGIEIGTQIEIMIRNKPVEAVVTSKKFLDKRYRKN